MTKSPNPGEYVRIYMSVIDDERFAGVYDDDHLFATYVRLLMVAEAAWPASGTLPRSARRQYVQALVTHGIVELGAVDRFRIHGLDPERQRRSDHARSAAVNRWSNAPSNAAGIAGRNAPSNAQSMLAETSRDETSRAEQEHEDGRADLDAFVAVRRRIPTPAQRSFMDAYCQTFDQTGPERAARLIWGHPDDPIGALKEDLAAFREERRVDALASETPKPRRTKGSGMSKVSDELAKLYLAPNSGNDAVPLADLVTPEALAAAGRKRAVQADAARPGAEPTWFDERTPGQPAAGVMEPTLDEPRDGTEVTP
jgi:hypothetical protein